MAVAELAATGHILAMADDKGKRDVKGAGPWPPNHIREWRQRAGLSLAELAKRVGFTDGSALNKIEKSQRRLDPQLAKRLAQELGCRAIDLIDPDMAGPSLSPDDAELLDLAKRLQPGDLERIKELMVIWSRR